MTRIGIIEVGSRSVRLMIGDFSRDGSFTLRDSKWFNHGLDVSQAEFVNLAKLWQGVEVYRDEVRRADVDYGFVYGTELCRRLNSNHVESLPEYLNILTPKQEAIASWAAGFMSVKELDIKRRYTIIDQGGGSVEFVSATWTGKNIEDVGFVSLDVGHRKLAGIVRNYNNGYPKMIREVVEEYAVDLNAHAGTAEVFLFGSVATKLAWINVRRDENHEYDPRLLNYTFLTVGEIYKIHDELVKRYRLGHDVARRYVDFRSNSQDEVEMLMGGSIFLMWSLLKLNAQRARVSGWGTRYGLAFLVKQKLIG